MHPTTLTRAAAALAIAVLAAGGGSRALAQAADTGAKYTALAIDMEAPAGNVATPIDIIVERWSTDAERDKVMNMLMEGGGQDKLLAVIQSLPRIGTLHATGSTGWGLRYARHGAQQDGRDRVLIIADRPVGFAEARDRPRTIDYPFAIVELRLGSNARGEGQLLFGAKMGIDKRTNTMVLENFGIQPIALNDVRLQKR